MLSSTYERRELYRGWYRPTERIKTVHYMIVSERIGEGCILTEAICSGDHFWGFHPLTKEDNTNYPRCSKCAARMETT